LVSNNENELLLKLKAGISNNELLQYFINQNIPIHSFNEVLPSLNEIFIKLVEGTTATRQFQPIN